MKSKNKKRGRGKLISRDNGKIRQKAQNHLTIYIVDARWDDVPPQPAAPPPPPLHGPLHAHERRRHRPQGAGGLCREVPLVFLTLPLYDIVFFFIFVFLFDNSEPFLEFFSRYFTPLSSHWNFHFLNVHQLREQCDYKKILLAYELFH